MREAESSTGRFGRDALARLTLLVMSCTFAALVLEYAARSLTAYPIHGRLANRTADPHLGYRMRPGLREIDASGFRNPVRPATVDIVVLGDSQTYGYGVSQHDTWPSQFATLSGHSVYSMAVGGYGAYQYRALLDEAIRLRPRLVVFALYPLNDASDLCTSQDYVVNRSHWEQVTGLPWTTCHGRSFGSQKRTGLAYLTDALSENVAVVSLMRHSYGLARSYLGMRGLLFALEPGSAVVSAHGSLYAFTPSTLDARSAMVDLSDPRIEAGARQLELALVDARNKCHGIQARVGVVLVPSRERVLEVPVLPPDLRERMNRIRSGERELVTRVARRAATLGIDVVDAASEMQRISSHGRRLYPDGEDDHPMVEGYRAIALSALNLLERTPQAPAGEHLP